MNRIDQRLEYLRASGRKMLSPYITAGDPEPGMTVDLMHALVAAGADVLELGIPFSDPMAEGPVIQAAMERALLHGVTCHDVLSMVRTFRLKDANTPIVLMGYMNPIEQYGYEKFAIDAHSAGVDGMIVVDLPPEESHDIALYWREAGLHNIYLCSPTTTEDRMQLLKEYAHGYLYYVSLKGVTGSNSIDLASVETQYLRRKTQTSLPVMVGFGTKTAEMAADVAGFADGVIVGAALINQIQDAYVAKKDSIKAGASLIQAMRRAMDTKGTKHD
jgi:tryptophan synthase alpha chain